MGGKKGLKGISDFFVQSAHETSEARWYDPASRIKKTRPEWQKGGAFEKPSDREEREATEAAAKEKIATRARIKPMPDPETGKAERRKAASRRRQRRGGRAATVLSGARETLG